MLQSPQRGFQGGGEGEGRQFAEPSLEGTAGSLLFHGNMTSWDVDTFQAGTQGMFV